MHSRVLICCRFDLLLALQLLPVEIELLQLEVFIDLSVSIDDILNFLSEVLGLITVVPEVLDIFADFYSDLALCSV